MKISTQTFTPDTCTASAVGGMKRAPLTSDPGINTVSAVKTMNFIPPTDRPSINTVGAANTGGDSIFSLIAGTALVAVGTAAVMTAAASAPISGPLAAAGGVAMGFGVSKLPS